MRAFRVTVPETEEDQATALLWEAGTAGIEVSAGGEGRTALLAYFPDEVSFDRLERALPDATIHTTFLDAYSAYTWDRVFGSTADFADHYFSSNDWLVRMTNESFPAAINVDIGFGGYVAFHL